MPSRDGGQSGQARPEAGAGPASARPWFRHRRLLASARRGAGKEARRLDRCLRQTLTDPVPGYSRAALGRMLAEYQLRLAVAATRFAGPFSLLFVLPLLLILLALTVGSDRLADRFEMLFILGIVLLGYLLLSLALLIHMVRRRASNDAIIRRYWTDEALRRAPRPGSPAPSTILVGLLVGASIVYAGSEIEPSRLPRLLITSAGALLWLIFLAIILLAAQRNLSLRRAPGPALTRSLATAYGLLIDAKPAQWRDIGYRRLAAAEISTAATILEMPTLRILSAIRVSPRFPESRQVSDAATGLRRLAATVLTKGVEAKSEIERSLAKALALAASGAVAGLQAAVPSEAEDPAQSRLGSALRFTRNILVALLPALGAAAILIAGDRYGWTLVEEVRPLLIQFAIISLIIGLMAALDPAGYQQRLSTITGAGGSLLGWGRGRG